MEELTNILIELKLNPISGWGDTIIVWKDNEIVSLKTVNEFLPKYIN